MEGVPPWEQQSCSSREKAEQHKESGHVGTIDRLVHCKIGENRVVASLSTHTHDSSHSTPAAIGTGEATFTDLYAEYGVRCTVTAVMRMRAKTCNDPVFPYYGAA